MLGHEPDFWTGIDGEVVVEKCRGKEFGWGYNAASGSYENLLDTGILDEQKLSLGV